MDPTTGTFTSMDTYSGSLSEPMSLHKYLFANSNPVAYCDPSGHEASLQGMVAAMTISGILSAVDSGIIYSLKNKESDTEKYGKSVYGWNLATEVMMGFLNGFILGFIGYALCLLLAFRIILSAVGLCIGIQQIGSGIDEITSTNGNNTLGAYTIAKGVVLTIVSTVGLAKSGAEFFDKYGDGKVFGKTNEYDYDTVRKTIKQSKAGQKWGTTSNGIHQGELHYSDYGMDSPDRLSSLETRLGVQEGTFDGSLDGFNSFTTQAERVVAEASRNGTVRQIDNKTIYYVKGAANPKKGVVVIVKDGKLQSMMPSDEKSFNKLC